jgi:hypothetical protein
MTWYGKILFYFYYKLYILYAMPLVHDLHCQVVDKIHIQMDAFLEDGSHEATISVIRALAVAVPHSTDRLREYILLTTFNVYILTIACMVD